MTSEDREHEMKEKLEELAADTYESKVLYFSKYFLLELEIPFNNFLHGYYKIKF